MPKIWKKNLIKNIKELGIKNAILNVFKLRQIEKKVFGMKSLWTVGRLPLWIHDSFFKKVNLSITFFDEVVETFLLLTKCWFAAYVASSVCVHDFHCNRIYKWK